MKFYVNFCEPDRDHLLCGSRHPCNRVGIEEMILDFDSREKPHGYAGRRLQACGNFVVHMVRPVASLQKHEGRQSGWKDFAEARS